LTEEQHDPDAGRGEIAPTDAEGLAEASGVDPAVIEQVALQMRLTFSGPLPPPEVLASYNEAVPNGADRIVKLTEDQAAHRRRLESRGQLLLFAFAVVALVGGIVLIAVGESASGLVPIIGSIGGLGGLFVYREYATRRTARQIEDPSEDA
jgi:uncharacterized membrane protein